MDSEHNQNQQSQGQPNQGHSEQPKKTPEPKSTLTGVEGFFDTYFREKAPFQFPPNAREWIVKYGPWIALVFLIIGAIVIIPLALVALGLTAATVPFATAAGQVSYTGLAVVSIIISLVTLVMQAIALPALFKRKMSGWKILYFSTLLSAAGSIIGMNIVGALIGLVVGMYILFQIRSYYK